jgi:hypothetical protein
MKKILMFCLVLLTPCFCVAQTTCKSDQFKGDDGKCNDWPKIASIELVHNAGDPVNYILPQGASIDVAWHVFLQGPSGKVDTVYGMSYCEKGSLADCREAWITFYVPRDYKSGDYRVLGAKFFDETVVLNDVLHVLPYTDNGVDKDDAKFVAQRQAELK